jgi:hypothetical protein
MGKTGHLCTSVDLKNDVLTVDKCFREKFWTDSFRD